MKPSELIQIDGREHLKYEEFKEQILKNTHRIYLSSDARMFDQMAG